MGWGNPLYQRRLGDEGIVSSSAKKELEVLDGQKLSMTWQCAPGVQKSNCILRCFKINVANRSRKVILPLCSFLVRLHLKYCTQLRSPHYRKSHGALGAGAEDSCKNDYRAGASPI